MLGGDIHSSDNARGMLFKVVGDSNEKWAVFGLGSIRGEYEPTVEHLKEFKKAENRQRAEAEMTYAKNVKIVEKAKGVLVAMGLPDAYSLYSMGNGRYDVDVRMSRTQLEWIVGKMLALSAKGE
jgi:hypothetical protein